MTTATETQLLLEGGAEHRAGWPEAQADALRAMRESVPDVPMPAVLRWRLTEAFPDMVEIAMADEERTNHLPVRRFFKHKWMSDSTARDLCHLEVLAELARVRSRVSAMRVDRLIQELHEQEGADGGQDGR